MGGAEEGCQVATDTFQCRFPIDPRSLYLLRPDEGITEVNMAMWWRTRAERIKGNGEVAVLRCSFCNKGQNDVGKLIAGPTVFICDECVGVCNDIIAGDDHYEKRGGGHVIPDEEPEGLGDEDWANAIPWPKAIECALCRVSIEPDEGILVSGRGTLCTKCVEAVAAAHQNSE